jgi:signal transduction histidine kinase
MSWITVIWSIAAGAALTLSAVHALVWVRQRAALEHLFFSVSATAAAVLAILELALMHSQTPAEYGAVLRWMHVPAAAITISIVWFIRFHLHAGRSWLAWLITSLRMAILILNFSLPANASFQEIHALREMEILGETLSSPIGSGSAWRILIQLSSMLLLVYTLDAAIVAWKRGRGRHALVLGASIVSATILAATFSSLMVRGVLPGPLISLVYLLVVFAMAFELSVDLIRSRQLAIKLLDSEKRMSLAAQAADLSLWEWNVVSDEVWANDGGSTLAGVPGSERHTLERYLAMVHPDDRDRLRGKLQHALEGSEDFQMDFRINEPHGAERWVAARGQVERSEQGQPLHLRGVSVDITARRRAQIELQRHRDELALFQRVSAMGQLSLTLAHELNQPLGAIIRNAEAGETFLLQDTPDVAELREILIDIQNDGRRAAEVINRMRSMLRHGDLHFDAIDVHELVGQIADLLNSEIQARHATLYRELPSSLPKVLGDRVQLQQVLLNLMLNSLDALDAKGSGDRRIEIEAGEVEGGLIELVIKDTGAGIDPDQLPHLFDLLLTTKAEGTGIGLAISKTIVDAHGGRIWAENNPDGGACMRLQLPIAREEKAA